MKLTAAQVRAVVCEVLNVGVRDLEGARGPGSRSYMGRKRKLFCWALRTYALGSAYAVSRYVDLHDKQVMIRIKEASTFTGPDVDALKAELDALLDRVNARGEKAELRDQLMQAVTDVRLLERKIMDMGARLEDLERRGA